MGSKFFLRRRCSMILIALFIFINQIIKVLSLSCKIKVPDTETSRKLNNIICIGTSGFSNPNIALFSNGSLIVESSKDAGSTTRYFYGITKDGKPYFSNNQYHMSLSASSGIYRKESQNFVVTLNDNKNTEYLLSIGYNTYLEIYDLKEGKILNTKPIKSFIGEFETMDCLRQTGISYYDGTNHFLFYGYVTLLFHFHFKKLQFSSTDLSKINIIASDSVNPVRGKVASCYITKQNNIGCIAIVSYLLGNYLFTYIYNTDLKQQINKILDWYSMVEKDNEFPYFIKCIHLREEIGVYAFYRSSGNSMVKNPVLLFKKYSNKKIETYISQIILDKKEFCMDALYNDLIKINDNKLCFISTSESKELLYIVLLNIYDNTNVAIRYYFLNIFSIYTFKIYASITASLYNNFISLAFSFCRTQSCSSTNDVHYPGFMIFSYPNGTDYNKNIIELMFSNNEKIVNYTINLYNQVRINNNIFGLKTSEIKIYNILNCNNINFG